MVSLVLVAHRIGKMLIYLYHREYNHYCPSYFHFAHPHHRIQDMT